MPGDFLHGLQSTLKWLSDKHSGISALGQVAKAKQEQLQHEINLKRAEFESEKAHPHEQLGRELAAVSGVPMPATHSVSGSVGGVPVAPNLYTLGAGALGLAAGAAGSRAAHAKGGHVKKRYADGGRVNNTDEIGRDIRNLIQEQRSADTRRHQEALKTNPLQSWLTHVGEEMLSNPSADPLLSMGRGTANTMRHLEASKERASNLYDKIQDSRLRQYQILAAYENQKAHREHESTALEEASKFREAQLNQAREFHKDRLGLQRSALDKSNFMEVTPKKVSITERKLENDAKKDMLRAIRMKKEVNHLGNLIEKTSTGPIVGGIKGILPKTKVDNQIEVGTNKLILDMHQGMKNIPRSEEFMKRIETTKPNIRNHPEANKEALNLMREGANDVEEHSISTLLSAGWTPERIEKQFKIKVPAHFYEQADESAIPPEEAASEAESEMVKMLGPDGSFAYVPAQNVKSALSAGATYAQ